MTQVFMDITGAQGMARKTGPLTAGMVGVPVVFSFSPEWAELNCLAVFRAGEVKKDNTITDGCSVIPAEVLTQSGQQLYMGVEGRSKQGDVVIPTVWAEVGRILEGAQAANDPALAPTPSQFERFMAQVEQMDGKIESALQEAKASGEFDGKTPVKGVDYFTEEEKQEIAEQAAELVDVLNVDLSDYVKTVNGAAPDENGNVEIEAGGTTNMTLLQSVDIAGVAEVVATPTNPVSTVVVLVKGAKNKSGASSLIVEINDNAAGVGFSLGKDGTGVKYGYAIFKHNGVMWECYQAQDATNNTSKIVANASMPYYHAGLFSGAATKICVRINSGADDYLPTGGTVEIYGG